MKGLSCKKYVKSFEITRKEPQHDFLDLFCRPAEPRFPIHIGISGYVAATGKVSQWNQDRIICFLWRIIKGVNLEFSKTEQFNSLKFILKRKKWASFQLETLPISVVILINLDHSLVHINKQLLFKRFVIKLLKNHCTKGKISICSND